MVPGSNDAILIIRMLRLLLVMKMAKKFPKLQLVVLTLIEGAGTIFTALLLFGMMLGLFGIIGCSIFSANDPWHFGDISKALITLVRAATFDDWTDVMYLNMYGCDRWESGDGDAVTECTDSHGQWSVSVLYFCVFVLASNMVFLNAVMGVIITSMGKVVEEMKAEDLIKRRLKLTRLKYGIPKRSIKLYRRAFNLINIENTGNLSPDELMVAFRGADISVSRRAVESILRYGLFQQMATTSSDFTVHMKETEPDEKTPAILSKKGRKRYYM
jgi:hypothetical protein